jgi:predicted DNA-binding transcriptional regulator YafY
MRRTDRLFDLIQTLRDGRLHTARAMAERQEVSVRTIWRDMATLIASGLPVEGERGVGYILREPIDLPPLALTPDEVEALRLGVGLVAQGADPSLAPAATGLLAKIEAALPRARRLPARETWVFPGAEAALAARHLPRLRQAVREGERLVLSYRDAQGEVSERPVRPLRLEFWGRVWTLAAWCETRGDFRSFRVDRIVTLQATGDHPAPEPGRDLAAYEARLRAAMAEPDG